MSSLPLDRLSVYRDLKPRGAAMNMAMDEALLELTRQPTLRFYAWSRPALSFGYFGKFADAIREGADRELVRRWTGGGIVLHGTDLTYSFVLPAADGTRARSARDTYAMVHAAMRDVLRESGMRAVLAESSVRKISEACFANPVPADLMLDGQKIAGAAQRRTRTGLLQQGSVQHQLLPRDFTHRFVAELSHSPEVSLFSDAIERRAQEIAAAKYGTARWLHLR